VTQKPILLTGASGGLGRMLTRELAARGHVLRLTDITPFPDSVPQGCVFERADLEDGVTIARLAEGVSHILHFGGVSTNQPFEEIFGPNLRGLYHIYEAARREGARVAFASSNHSIGFHAKPEAGGDKLDADCQFRPDSFYGLSKAYGELMGRLYWDKHGVENINYRIGSCFVEPIDRRQLSIWLSYADLVRLVEATIAAPRLGHSVIWGCSNNPESYWDQDHRARIGWVPQDTAEVFRDKVGHITADHIATQRHQGGPYCQPGYSRPTPPPVDAFDLD
jgi:uronate dehydrogenase